MRLVIMMNVRSFSASNIGITSCGGLGHMPLLDSNKLFFSVRFRTAQSLTVTLCCYLSKHLHSATVAAVVLWRLYELRVVL